MFVYGRVDIGVILVYTLGGVLDVVRLSHIELRNVMKSGYTFDDKVYVSLDMCIVYSISS